MKLKLVAAVSALAIPALAHAEQSGPRPAVPMSTKADAQKIVQVISNDKVVQPSSGDADLDEDFSIIAGLSGGPTSYLDGIKEMPWALKLLDQCGLNEQQIRSSAKSAIMRTRLGFVSSDEDVLERPLFQLIVTVLPASSGCAASVSSRVPHPIGANLRQIKATGTKTLWIKADPPDVNLMNPDEILPALRAGYDRAKQEAGGIKTFWA